jgi:hypothetical protein
MVRRGSTVRVRQRALAKAPQTRGFCSPASLHFVQFARALPRRWLILVSVVSVKRGRVIAVHAAVLGALLAVAVSDASSEAAAWRLLTPSPLAPRSGHVAVWTGHEMIIWGKSSRTEIAACDLFNAWAVPVRIALPPKGRQLAEIGVVDRPAARTELRPGSPATGSVGVSLLPTVIRCAGTLGRECQRPSQQTNDKSETAG